MLLSDASDRAGIRSPRSACPTHAAWQTDTRSLPPASLDPRAPVRDVSEQLDNVVIGKRIDRRAPCVQRCQNVARESSSSLRTVRDLFESSRQHKVDACLVIA